MAALHHSMALSWKCFFISTITMLPLLTVIYSRLAKQV